MFFAIDGRPLIRQPHQVEIQPYEHEAGLTADGRPTVRPAGPYVQINATFGADLTYEDVLRELHRRRANRGVHMITFEDWRGKVLISLNAYMGEPRHTHVGQDSCGRLISSGFTVPFIQVDTPTCLFPLRVPMRGTLSAVSPFAFKIAPAAGQILAVDGYILTLGTGAGQTRIQVHNENSSLDYLATPGDFVVAGGDHKLVNQVLGTSLDFAGGDQISVNVTGVPAGADSADALVIIWAWMFRP